jgi:hypothetical protein
MRWRDGEEMKRDGGPVWAGGRGGLAFCHGRE